MIISSNNCIYPKYPFYFMAIFSAKLLLTTRSYLTFSIKMATRTVLILRSGPRIGDAVSQKFAADGYKVTLVSRKGPNSFNEKGYLSLQADFPNTDPSLLASIFDKVKSEFKAAPSVVIYNAGSITPPPDADSPCPSRVQVNIDSLLFQSLLILFQLMYSISLTCFLEAIFHLSLET